MLEVGVEVVDQQLLLQLLLNVYEEIRTLSWDALNLTATLDLYHAYLYKRVCVYNFHRFVTYRVFRKNCVFLNFPLQPIHRLHGAERASVQSLQVAGHVGQFLYNQLQPSACEGGVAK